MTYIIIPPIDKSFEWDPAKSDRNSLERRPTLERLDAKLEYREARTLAIGMVGSIALVCVYTDRGLTRRIISLRPANRRERDVYRAAFEN